MNQLARAKKTIMDLQAALESAPAVTTNMDEFTDHFFAPGVYLRTLFIPKGYVLVGKEHKYETLNILLKGKISVVVDDGQQLVAEAPFIFRARPGQKAGYAIEDCWYANIFPNEDNIVDIKVLENKFTVPAHNALENLS